MCTKIDLRGSKIILGVNSTQHALGGAIQSRDSGIFVVSQPPVWDLYGSEFLKLLEIGGAGPKVHLIPDGEAAKNLKELGHLLEWLAIERADRSSLIVVLGGGVVGDLAGFAAATYMRGIPWVYVPTTLLAQQDASVGGKVGVNLPQGKNLAGHFWAPRQVIIDCTYLKTLTPQHRHSGFMELLKHGILNGRDLYESLLGLDPLTQDWSPHLDLLVRGVQVKAKIVEKDPIEKHERRLLNLGHTLGHALESWSNFELVHGEAVGFGLIFASLLGQRLGSSFSWSPLHNCVIDRLGKLDEMHLKWEDFRPFLAIDKKSRSGEVTWVVPMAPGNVKLISPVADSDLQFVFRQWRDRVSG